MNMQDIDVLVPKLIVSACKYIEDNVEIEGIYRLSGSAARQKVVIVKLGLSSSLSWLLSSELQSFQSGLFLGEKSL